MFCVRPYVCTHILLLNILKHFQDKVYYREVTVILMLNRQMSAVVSENCVYRDLRHQEMKPSQTLNLPGDDRRRMVSTDQASTTSHCRDGLMTERWVQTPRQNSLKLVSVSRRVHFNKQLNGFIVPGRNVNLEQASSDNYLYDGFSDRQRVTAV